MTVTNGEMLPTLAILVPFDLGIPVFLADNPHLRRGLLGRPSDCERLARDRAVQNALGNGVTVSIRSEATRYLGMNLISETESFPYGTVAVLGQALRLTSATGRMIECWRDEAIAIMDTPWSRDFEGSSTAVEALRVCRFQLVIDAFACGAACLRLFIWLPRSTPELVTSCASLLEYALYGDIPALSTGSRRLDETNRLLRSVCDALIATFGDKRVGRGLHRQRAVFRNRSDWMALRWTMNVLKIEQCSDFEHAIAAIRSADEDHGPTTGSLVDIKTVDFRYHDDPWMATISVSDPDTYFRVLYVLCVSEAISLLMINLAQNLDEKLGAAVLSGDTASHSDKELRDIRFFTQAIRGLGSTWRISAVDTDVAIADSRGRHYQHDRYQSHLAAASETLYALESARLADQQRRRTDAFGILGLLIAATTLWSLVLALKDVSDLVEKAGPHLTVHPKEFTDYLLDVIVGTLIVVGAACVAIMPRLFKR